MMAKVSTWAIRQDYFFTLLIVPWMICSGIPTENPRDVQTTPFKSEADRRVNFLSSQDIPGCPRFPQPVDCEEILENGQRESGIYEISPKSRVMNCDRIRVYCDMETDGGGWTVIQRRGQFNNPQDYFVRSWEEYKTGFGSLRKEFWLGNNNIFAITSQRSYSVRFDMRKRSGTTAFALYQSFFIEEAEKNFKLHISGYSGTAGDALGAHNLRDFYTRDKPNIPSDVSKDGQKHQTGWWYNIFPSSNLNGINRQFDFSNRDGITWDPFTGYENSLEFTEIKVRSKKL